MLTGACELRDDPFSDVLGDGRGVERPPECSATAALTGTEQLITQHLHACGWFERLAANGSVWWQKAGHARYSAAGELVGERFTTLEALGEQVAGEQLRAAGWVFRAGAWRHLKPPAQAAEREYVYAHAHEAGGCQYYFERCVERR